MIEPEMRRTEKEDRCNIFIAKLYSWRSSNLSDTKIRNSSPQLLDPDPITDFIIFVSAGQ